MSTLRVGVVGAGVAGLSTAWHWLDIWEARRRAGLTDLKLELTLIAALTLDGYVDGSGLGGKAMSRSFTGRTDPHGLDRQLFYGPMMPHKGVVPHGYHVLWEYPNLRGMLGDGDRDEPEPVVDGGILLPRGGAGAIAVFQGVLDDPMPGGPGIAVMGLSDPSQPWTATRSATRALYRLQSTLLARIFTKPMSALFGDLADRALAGVHPMFFADLFYAHEVDLEMRLALIFSSMRARKLDPERATLGDNGAARPLWDVEFSDFIEAEISGWARELRARVERSGLPDFLDEITSRAWLLEALVESVDLLPVEQILRGALPEDSAGLYDDAMHVYLETERVLRALPGALARLATGAYPVARTLHLRFGPDATFTSPYSFDAAQALRSLAFVFTTPRSARAWTADGAMIQRLWKRLWERLEAKALGLGDLASLRVEKGRASALRAVGETVEIEWGDWLGHGFGLGPPGEGHVGGDLSFPHAIIADPALPPPANPRTLVVDVCHPTMAPPLLAELLVDPAHAAARASLAPLLESSNPTLELVIWTRERFEYSQAARTGLGLSSLTGLEGGFCLLADYSQGLWSDAALAEEDPFGDGQFKGAVLESCGAFDDLFAALDRDDAWGWPAEVKHIIANLYARPEHFEKIDKRRWTADEAGWEKRRASGSWTPQRIADPSAMDDWWVASRWLTWRFLRQLSGVHSLGSRAVRQFEYYSKLLDPRALSREQILRPPAALQSEIRYVVMLNAKARNRIFSPGVGLWPHRPISGAPLAPGIYPAGDWTRNGLDTVCMEAACISGKRAARGACSDALDQPVPVGTPPIISVLPPSCWYVGLDPLARPGVAVGEGRRKS